ncbi:Signal transduction histidine kinase [Bosea sp. CRIB-10]|uniref:ATP-binding protein n=1 Tax=Bosea sp. CRIB-10 TaxID=378404 RepID=UPI0008DED1D1|nr:ATP-binding protein [Bosea sp. CRIB-10]SFC73144.1 Signal transduction histidine kinase [Bosea sp. CRIB-10]
MTPPAKRLWPDTVASRAILILVAALLAFHLLGYWAYRVGVENLATANQDRGLAERIVSIKRAIASLPQAPERDRVAHDLSSASLEVHWSKVSLVLGTAPMTERTRAMEARLKELAPELAAESFRVGFADDGALGAGEANAYKHMMLVSVRLDDGSWVNFSSSALGASQHLDWGLTAIMICFAVGIVVVALLLLRWATRPLRDLAEAAERFSLDQAPQPLPETGPVEVRRAARAFNTMRERIRHLVTERMQAMAAVSHDLRTPITRLRLRSEFLEDDATRALIDADLGEMEAMIDSTLDYLRGGTSSEPLRPVDLASVIETIVDEHVDQGHFVLLVGLNSAPVSGRLLSLKRAASNIIGNAVKYGQEAKVSITDAGDSYAVVVEDEGPGIAEADRERVFHPFVRLEESRGRQTGGSGLGLTIALAIVRSHDGSIALENRAEGGLRVTVSLPKL